MLQDLKYALRQLAKRPGFTALVVLTLAVGIAANTAVFSLLNPFLLRELPFERPDRLVHLYQVDRDGYPDEIRLSLPQFADWKERSAAFEDLAAYAYGNRNVTGAEEPERVQVGRLTANMLPMLGVAPALGRAFLPGEDGSGGAEVVVLGHGIWQRRYGGDPAVIGRVIPLDGVPHTVIGVMPASFNFPFAGVKMWTPIRRDAATERRDRNTYLVVGRLRVGWTAERAQEELSTIHRELAAAHPETDGRFGGANVEPLREALVLRYDLTRTISVALAGAVGFVLLIACANVASLTLARTGARAREVSIRAAIGAGRGRLVRQFLTESAVLAVLGGGLGVLLASWAVGILAPVIPENVFRVGEIAVDRQALLFTAAISLATPLLFGLVPALVASRPDLAESLKDGSRGAGWGLRGSRGRRVLVMAQVGLALALLTGAGLMIRSLLAMRSVELGFAPERVLAVDLTLPAYDYPEQGDVRAFYDRALGRIRAVPGARSAGLVAPLPLNHRTLTTEFRVDGPPPGSADDGPRAEWFHASGSYFDAMGIPLLRGRLFTAADGPNAPEVVLVNRELAERYWPGVDPVGRQLSVGEGADAWPATVIGVVGAVRHRDVSSGFEPQIYAPFAQAQPSMRRRHIVVRADGSPTALAAAVRGAIRDVDPNLPIGTLQPMDAVVAEAMLPWSLTSALMGAFGGVALLLAALGIYGVTAYSVARRTREIGIRIACGARGKDVLRLVVGEGLRLTAIGVALGLALAFAVGRLLASLLFGVGAADPVTFALIAATFVGVGLLASYVPARRATRVDPMKALRYE